MAVMLEIIQASLFCRSADDLAALVSRMGALLPFDHSVALWASFGADFSVQDARLFNISYPQPWLDAYIAQDLQKHDPIMIENFTQFRFQKWSDTFRKNADARTFCHSAADFSLTRGITHGMRQAGAGLRGTLFSFAGDSVEYRERSRVILEHLTPHLNAALLRVVQAEAQGNAPRLSAREIEVLQWVKSGKSSWEISVILGLSESTINYHIKNIVAKLGVSNRSHAVAAAIHAGLIPLD